MDRVRPARTIDELRVQFEQIAEHARAWDGVDLALLSRRPATDSWSANECLIHLNLSLEPYFPLWHAGIATAPRHTVGAYRLDWWGRVLVWTMEPPPRFRFPTTPPFKPALGAPGPSAVAPFLERQQRIIQVIESARGCALDVPRIRSPFNSRVQYTIWSSLCVTASHERRHLWQGQRALAAALSQA